MHPTQKSSYTEKINSEQDSGQLILAEPPQHPQVLMRHHPCVKETLSILELYSVGKWGKVGLNYSYRPESDSSFTPEPNNVG